MSQNLDGIARKLREGKLVPGGTPRKATIASLLGYAPKPGEALPGPFVIVSVAKVEQVRGDGDTWEAEIVPLVEADPSNEDTTH